MAPTIAISPSTSFLAWMQKEIRRSNKIYLFSAFLTKGGFDLISSELHSFLKDGGELFLVTGFFQGITDSEPLSQCLNWSKMGLKSYPYVSLIRTFHAKMYLYEQKDTFSFSCGSSNLTPNGITSCGEINTILSGISINGQTANELRKIINYVLDSSVAFNEVILDKYEQKRQSLIKAYASGKEHSKQFLLDKILNKKTILSSDAPFFI